MSEQATGGGAQPWLAALVGPGCTRGRRSTLLEGSDRYVLGVGLLLSCIVIGTAERLAARAQQRRSSRGG
jgi:hypothetical protein